jgi:hypothetical protein
MSHARSNIPTLWARHRSTRALSAISARKPYNGPHWISAAAVETAYWARKKLHFREILSSTLARLDSRELAAA